MYYIDQEDLEANHQFTRTEIIINRLSEVKCMTILGIKPPINTNYVLIMKELTTARQEYPGSKSHHVCEQVLLLRGPAARSSTDCRGGDYRLRRAHRPHGCN